MNQTRSSVSVFSLVMMLWATIVHGNLSNAVLVSSSVSGTVLADDFESPGITLAPNNGALPGSWTTTANGSSVVQIWDSTLAPNINAHEDNQYVNLQRDGSNSAILSGTLSSTVTSGSLLANFAVFVPVGSPQGTTYVYLDQSGSQFTIDIRTSGSGQIQRYNGSSWVNIGVAYTEGEWQDWYINADLAAQTYSMQVAGSSVSGLSFNLLTGGDGTFSRITFEAGNAGAQFFLDAIPEPTSLALLAMGGLVFFCRRR